MTTGSTLADKLRIRPGQRVALVNAPPSYPDRLAPLPEGAEVMDDLDRAASAVHLFVGDAAELARLVGSAQAAVAPGGLLWIAYRKGGVKAGTDLNRDILRDTMATAHGWDSVTLVALDDAWSAMRFRPSDRASAAIDGPSSGSR